MSYLLELQSATDAPGSGPAGRTLTVASSASLSVCSFSTFSLSVCAG